MTTFPLPTLAAQVLVTGISAPSYPDDLSSLQASFKGIFGDDAYIEPDSQDGQWIAIIAQAVNDTNNMAMAVYSAFSPATAQGIGLSTVVKINGLARHVSSNSTVDLLITGDPGTTVIDGIAEDSLGSKWEIGSFNIPPGGSLTQTATCLVAGAVTAAPNTITTITTPTRGWLTVNNPGSASAGEPVEDDATLRQRQSFSTGNNSLTPTKTLVGNILALNGVTQAVAYENDGDVTDANGLPPHSISMVVEGGSAAAIAQIILDKKTQGGNTYGTTVVSVPNYAGVPQNINFFRPTLVTIQVEITLHPLSGFSTVIEAQIQAALGDYINNLPIGSDVFLSKLYVPANLGNSSAGDTYDISLIRVGKNGGALGTSDIVIAFNEEATNIPVGVTFILT